MDGVFKDEIDGIEYDAFEIEIPDKFKLGEIVMGEKHSFWGEIYE